MTFNASEYNDVTKLCLPNQLSVTLWGLVSTLLSAQREGDRRYLGGGEGTSSIQPISSLYLPYLQISYTLA